MLSMKIKLLKPSRLGWAGPNVWLVCQFLWYIPRHWVGEFCCSDWHMFRLENCDTVSSCCESELLLVCIENVISPLSPVFTCCCYTESLRDNAEFGHYLAELSSYGVKRLCKSVWCLVLHKFYYTAWICNITLCTLLVESLICCMFFVVYSTLLFRASASAEGPIL